MTDKERMEEFWVAIPTHPDYSVSNYGTVRNTRRDRDLRPTIRKDGRVQVTLSRKGWPQQFLVHRLVAEAFFENYDPYKHVYFINGIRHDCSVVNLTLDRSKVNDSD